MPGAFVQAATAFVNTTGTVALGSAVASGNTLVLFLFDVSNTGGVYTVSDNRNGTWPAALGSFNDNTFGGEYLVFAKGGAVAGSTTVTVSEANGHSMQAVVVEVSGVAATADGFKGNGFSGTAGANGLVVGSLTNASQPAMLLACILDTNAAAAPTAGTGFTQDFQFNDTANSRAVTVEHQRLTTTGSHSTTFTGTTDYYAGLAVALDESGGGGGLPDVPPLNEASLRRPNPRPIPIGGEPLEPLVRRQDGISVTPPERRRDMRQVFAGDAAVHVVVPPAIGPAGIDVSTPLVRQPARWSSGGADGLPALVASIGPPLTGLKLWLKADAGITLSGSSVTAWADQSGNGNDLTSTGAHPAFTASVINGRPGVTWTALALLSNASSGIVASNSARHVIAVVLPAATSGPYSVGGPILDMRDGHSFTAVLGKESGPGTTDVFTDGATVNTSIVSPPILTNTAWEYELSSTGFPGMLAASLNGTPYVLSSSATVTDSGSAKFSVGSRVDAGNSQWFGGSICEILVYDHVVTGGDLAAVRAYLAARYFPVAGIGGIDISPPFMRAPGRALGGSSDVAAALLTPSTLGPYAEASPALWRPSPRFAPASDVQPRPPRAPVTVEAAAIAGQRRPDRAPPPTAAISIGALPPQTVVVATTPAASTRALGLTYTDARGTGAPTRARPP